MGMVIAVVMMDMMVVMVAVMVAVMFKVMIKVLGGFDLVVTIVVEISVVAMVVVPKP